MELSEHQEKLQLLCKALGLASEADLNDPKAVERLYALLKDNQKMVALVESMNRDLNYATDLIERLRHYVHATKASTAWRAGWLLVRLNMKLLRKPCGKSALDDCESVFDVCDHWKLTRD